MTIKNNSFQNFEHYDGSGLLFTNGTVLLGGYQKKFNRNGKETSRFISGFGGSKDPGENVFQTAVRETLEDIYEFEELPEKLIEQIIQQIGKPYEIKKTTTNGYTYVTLIYGLRKLEKIIKLVYQFMKNRQITSLAYEILPQNIGELLFLRRDPQKEIISVCVLPLDKISGDGYKIHPDFQKDINFLKKMN